MKKVLLSFVTLIASVAARAAAPESVAGLIFEVYSESLVSRVYSTWWLQSDGTYVQLIDRLLFGEAIAFSGYQTPSQGRYSYLKTGPNTATFVFTDENPLLPRAREVQLHFTSDDGGPLEGGLQRGAFAFSDPRSRTSLVNVSARMMVRAETPSLVGFTITDPIPRDVLIRVVGPGLAGFGVKGALKDPRLTVMQHNFVRERNDNWGDVFPYFPAASVQRIQSLVGAFPLAVGSKDSAIITTLEPGAYTVTADAVDSADEGEVLIEVYLLPYGTLSPWRW